MSRWRRGLLLVGLALLLGGLAASDVGRREAALRRHLSPSVPVVVATEDLEPRRRVRRSQLIVRRVPMRYAPRDGAATVAEVAGARTVASVPAGAYLTFSHVTPEGPGASAGLVRRGERAAEIVATGSRDLISAGTRVDVLVTREDGGRAATELALQDVEVLSAAAVEPRAGTGPGRVAATLRVSLRQAVFLTAAQSFAREIRLLPRAAGDGRRAGALRVGAGLR